MAGPMHKLWMARCTEARVALSEEERQSLTAKVREPSDRVGCKILIICGSA